MAPQQAAGGRLEAAGIFGQIGFDRRNQRSQRGCEVPLLQLGKLRARPRQLGLECLARLDIGCGKMPPDRDARRNNARLQRCNRRSFTRRLGGLHQLAQIGCQSVAVLEQCIATGEIGLQNAAQRQTLFIQGRDFRLQHAIGCKALLRHRPTNRRLKSGGGACQPRFRLAIGGLVTIHLIAEQRPRCGMEFAGNPDHADRVL